MAGRCRYGQLILAAANLSAVEPELLFDCDEPAEHKATIASDDDGFVIEITTPVCPVHDVLVSLSPTYRRSIKLRAPATT